MAVQYRLQGSHVLLATLVLSMTILAYHLGGAGPQLSDNTDKSSESTELVEVLNGADIQVPSQTHSAVRGQFDWISLFTFVPNGLKKCQNLFQNRKYLVDPFWTEFQEHKREVEKFENIEGYSALRIEQYLTYVKLAEASFIRTVCETGFNAGHSTLVWLSINPRTHVYSFDMGSHDYARPMADYLSRKFPGRLNVTWGDSIHSLPEFHEKHPDIKCDLMVVDGGHTYAVAQSDFDVFQKMANKQENMVLLDNYPDTRLNWMEDLGNVWERARRKGDLSEIFSCSFLPEDPQGFSVGRLTF